MSVTERIIFCTDLTILLTRLLVVGSMTGLSKQLTWITLIF